MVILNLSWMNSESAMFCRVIIGLITAVGLAACGGGHRVADCAATDWYERGLADGERGEDIRLLERYNRQCEPVGVEPDEKQYLAGFLAGVESYCTFEAGRHRGSQGGQAYRHCSADSPYALGYREGLDTYIEREERRRLERLTRPSSHGSGGLGH